MFSHSDYFVSGVPRVTSFAYRRALPQSTKEIYVNTVDIVCVYAVASLYYDYTVTLSYDYMITYSLNLAHRASEDSLEMIVNIPPLRQE